MKKLIRLLCLLLALTCFVSCQQDQGGEDNNETTVETQAPEAPQEPLTLIEGGKTQYKLICSTEADSVTRNAMIQIRQAFQSATGVSIGTSDDYLKEGETHDDDTCKILVGVTNYEESQKVYKKLKYNDFLIKTEGTHLLIIAFNEGAFDRAVFWLKDNVFSKVTTEGDKKNLILQPTEHKGSLTNGIYTVPSWTIGDKDLEEYRLVYGADALKPYLFEMRREIGEMTGYYLDIVKDTASAAQECEILFGDTNRAESTSVQTPTYLNYTVQVVGNKLVVKSGGEYSTAKFLQQFVDVFCGTAFKVAMESTYRMDGDYYDDPFDVSRAAGSDARVMTCNILGEWNGYGGEDAPVSLRKEIFFSMLDYYQPTVVGLQEMSPTWYDCIENEYRDADKWDLLKYKNPNVSGENVASTIMYRKDLYQLINSGSTYYSGYNNGRCRCITWALLKDKTSGKEFCFVSTHWDGHISIEKEDNNVQVQLDEICEFVNTMREQYPVITTGDFNSNEYTSTFKTYLQRIESSDAKYSTKLNLNPSYGSWHGLGIATPSAGSCDHITTTNKDIAVLKFEMLYYNEQIYGSDHAWAYADIQFK